MFKKVTERLFRLFKVISLSQVSICYLFWNSKSFKRNAGSVSYFFLFGLEEAQCRCVVWVECWPYSQGTRNDNNSRIGEFRLWGFQLLQTKSHFSVVTKCQNLKKQKQLFVKIKIKYCNTHSQIFLTTIQSFPQFFFFILKPQQNIQRVS